MPQMSIIKQISADVMLKANLGPVVKEEILAKLLYFCEYSIPADMELLPKMLTLLQEFHKTGNKMNQWYFQMQDCIKNHYRIQGNCFFFKDSKEILKGTKAFDAFKTMKANGNRVANNGVDYSSGLFGLKLYL